MKRLLLPGLLIALLLGLKLNAQAGVEVSIADADMGYMSTTQEMSPAKTLLESLKQRFPSISKKQLLITAAALLSVGATVYYYYTTAAAIEPALPDAISDDSFIKIMQGQGLGVEDQQDVLGVISYFKELSNGSLRSSAWAKPGGILISGAPGTGKTTVGVAIAKAAGCDVIEGSPAELASPEKIVQFFAAAREKAQEGCKAVFLDEMDQVSKVGSETLNQLLLETERGVEGNKNILLLGATNFPEVIAPSAQRSGRFDFHLRVKLPDIMQRAKIFKDLLKKMAHAITDNDVQEAAKISEGLSYADLANIVRRAWLRCIDVSSCSLQGSSLLASAKQVVKKVRGF